MPQKSKYNQMQEWIKTRNRAWQKTWNKEAWNMLKNAFGEKKSGK